MILECLLAIVSLLFCILYLRERKIRLNLEIIVGHIRLEGLPNGIHELTCLLPSERGRYFAVVKDGDGTERIIFSTEPIPPYFRIREGNKGKEIDVLYGPQYG